jgi:hypothetical protein
MLKKLEKRLFDFLDKGLSGIEEGTREDTDTRRAFISKVCRGGFSLLSLATLSLWPVRASAEEQCPFNDCTDVFQYGICRSEACSSGSSVYCGGLSTPPLVTPTMCTSGASYDGAIGCCGADHYWRMIHVCADWVVQQCCICIAVTNCPCT